MNGSWSGHWSQLGSSSITTKIIRLKSGDEGWNLLGSRGLDITITSTSKHTNRVFMSFAALQIDYSSNVKERTRLAQRGLIIKVSMSQWIEVGGPGANSTWFSDYGDIDCMQISAGDSRPARCFSTYAYEHCLILEGRPREAVCYAHKSDKCRLRISQPTQTRPSTQQPVSTLWPVP